MTISTEIQCDHCGVKAPPYDDTSALPNGWFMLEILDYQGAEWENLDLCPSCYEAARNAIEVARLLSAETRRAALEGEE